MRRYSPPMGMLYYGDSLGARLAEARTGVDDADLHALPLASSLARASQAAGHSPVSPS